MNHLEAQNSVYSGQVVLKLTYKFTKIIDIFNLDHELLQSFPKYPQQFIVFLRMCSPIE